MSRPSFLAAFRCSPLCPSKGHLKAELPIRKRTSAYAHRLTKFPTRCRAWPRRGRPTGGLLLACEMLLSTHDSHLGAGRPPALCGHQRRNSLS